MANKRQRKKRMNKQMKLREQMAQLKEMEQLKLIEVIPANEVTPAKSWLDVHTKVPVIQLASAPETVTEPPTTELYKGKGKYAAENKEYQALLDNRYPEGRIQPIEKYINNHSSILHHCNKCGTDFYGKPVYMLGEDHQKHVCTMPYGDKDGKRLSSVRGKQTSRKKKNTLNVNQFYSMVWNDYTYKEIAQEFIINPNIIKEYFKAEGLI